MGPPPREGVYSTRRVFSPRRVRAEREHFCPSSPDDGTGVPSKITPLPRHCRFPGVIVQGSMINVIKSSTFAKLYGIHAVSTVALLAACTASSKPPEAPAAPTPPAIKALGRFVGNWRGTGKLTIGKDAAPVSMTWSCARAAAGSGIQCHFVATG